LIINGVEDLAGNMAIDSIRFTYIETQAADISDIVINEFMPNPDPQGAFPFEYIELYNRSNKHIDLQDWVVKDRSSPSGGFPHYILAPDSYVILLEEGATNTTGPAISVKGFPSLNNSSDSISIISTSGDKIHNIWYADSEKGLSWELVNPNSPCSAGHTYGYSQDKNGGSPNRKNSIFDDSPDTVAPTIQGYSVDSVLRVHFSEGVTAASILSTGFEVEGLEIQSVIFEGDVTETIQIAFTDDLEKGRLYTLSLSGPADCSGNKITPTTLHFGIAGTPGFNELIITEIMYNEQPATELPAAEYLEIYNASSRILALGDITLHDATKHVKLPNQSINPNTYHVLTKTSMANYFEKGIGVSGFPTLNNGGEQLALTVGEELVFSVEYHPSWHTTNEGSGGYALEMIDVTNPCGGSENWASSLAINKGTPGLENSVSGTIPDNFGPTFDALTLLAPDSLEVRFNEPLHPATTKQAQLKTDPEIQINQLGYDWARPSSLMIQLDNPLEPNKVYQLKLEDVLDCKQNSSGKLQTSVVRPVQMDSINHAVVLSEVLFNPSSTGVDFVEVHNNSGDHHSLKGWKLARKKDGAIETTCVISHSELVIAPHDYIVFTPSKPILTGAYRGNDKKYRELGSFPSFPNTEGTIVLMDAAGRVVEEFTYHEDLHYQLLENVDGVSLERISYAVPENDRNNWHSASSQVGYATPGYANSQSMPEKRQAGKVSIEPKVFVPGDGFTTIKYEVANGGQFANIMIYDNMGRPVRSLAEGVLLSTSGFIQWDGLTESGAMARLGYYAIVIELFDSMGNHELMKETVVVGRDF